jgi:hypothetical protein
MATKTELPKSPTRERRVYLASVRIYVNLFRAVFAVPLEARRGFRKLAESRSPDTALDALWQRPETFGPQRTSASHVHDPAFVYWTQRPRRPRALLKRAAAGIARELSRRDHQRLLEEDRLAERRAGEASSKASESRDKSRRAASDVIRAAEWVYAEPKEAARALLRATRANGSAAVLTIIEATPAQFGALLVNRVPVFRDVPILGDWRWLMVFQRDTHEEALSFVPRLREKCSAATSARAARTKAGRARRLRAALIAAQRRVREREGENTALAGGLKEAAQQIAMLLRRRAIDEQPEGDKGPPAITTQLAAMLPARAKQLINDAVHMAEKESGDEYADWQVELQRGRDRQRGGWERDRGRGGMSL